jgi:hypothetical protein
MYIMDSIDQRFCDVLFKKLGELYILLSPEAKKFIQGNIEEEDILDFYHIIEYYQLSIRDRFYSEEADEEDYRLIDIMKNVLKAIMNLMDTMW